MSVAELEVALRTMGLTFHRATRSGGALMLEGCLESAGRPVHLRLEAGVLDTAEDFGFLTDEGRVRLVCGDVDRALLEERLLAPLHARILQTRLHLNADSEIRATGEEVRDDEVVIHLRED